MTIFRYSPRKDFLSKKVFPKRKETASDRSVPWIYCTFFGIIIDNHSFIFVYFTHDSIMRRERKQIFPSLTHNWLSEWLSNVDSLFESQVLSQMNFLREWKSRTCCTYLLPTSSRKESLSKWENESSNERGSKWKLWFNFSWIYFSRLDFWTTKNLFLYQHNPFHSLSDFVSQFLVKIQILSPPILSYLTMIPNT